MANNRIYLRCKNCGEAFFLGKTFGDGYYTQDEYYGKGNTMIKRLNMFYDKHVWEDSMFDEEEREDRWQGMDCFDIVYENDRDFEQKVTGYF